MNCNKVLIWDSPNICYESNFIAILWQSNTALGKNHLSISRYVDENAMQFRAEYLAYIYELGKASVRNDNCINALKIRKELSLWWLTTLAEKCNYDKSPAINDAIKMFAFSDWSKKNKFTEVELFTSNQKLSKVFRAWCKDRQIQFKLIADKKKFVPIDYINLKWGTVLTSLKNILWLPVYLMRRWPLRKVGLEGWKNFEGGLTIFSYLYNLDSTQKVNDYFKSNYWGELPSLLRKNNKKVNWLHLYIEDKVLPNAIDAKKILENFNSKGAGQVNHVTLDTFLGVKVVLRSVKQYLSFYYVGFRVGKILKSKKYKDINLWPLLADDWNRSIYGIHGLENILYLNLFELALGELPGQKLGLFLQENLSWETSLIYAWNKYAHGCLIGVPHSTIRFWDLRYFRDIRVYKDKANGLPLPHKVACNGPVAIRNYALGGYPESDLLEVEALRYQYLINQVLNLKPQVVEPLSILIIGDYSARKAEFQLRLLDEASMIESIDALLYFKPHTSSYINLEKFRNLKIITTEELLADLVSKCSIAYVSSGTSGAIDAYLSGLGVISALDLKSTNLSPLYGFKDVYFVSTPHEINNALKSLKSRQIKSNIESDYFVLDHSMSRWNKLISTYGI